MINPSLLLGPPVTFQSLAPAAAPAPAPRSPVSLGTNMEELLKGIPPNVSIPTNADQPPGEFILEWLMQLLPRGLFSIKSTIFMILHTSLSCTTLNTSSLFSQVCPL